MKKEVEGGGVLIKKARMRREKDLGFAFLLEGKIKKGFLKKNKDNGKGKKKRGIFVCFEKEERKS